MRMNPMAQTNQVFLGGVESFTCSGLGIHLGSSAILDSVSAGDYL
jgi:hypothetical protein